MLMDNNKSFVNVRQSGAKVGLKERAREPHVVFLVSGSLVVDSWVVRLLPSHQQWRQ
jgi:hypothetical protein